MKLSKYLYSQPVAVIVFNTCSVINCIQYKYLYDVDNFEPTQYIDFDLLSGKNPKKTTKLNYDTWKPFFIVEV